MAAHVSKTENMSAFLGKRDPKVAAKRLKENEAWFRTRDEVTGMMGSGDWSAAEGRHLAGLHVVLFESVYGVKCSELAGPGRHYAAQKAEELLELRFDGDVGAMVAYVRWVWEREVSREKWRREYGKDGGCLSYRWLFGEGKTLDEYTLACARRARQ